MPVRQGADAKGHNRSSEPRW